MQSDQLRVLLFLRTEASRISTVPEPSALIAYSVCQGCNRPQRGSAAHLDALRGTRAAGLVAVAAEDAAPLAVARVHLRGLRALGSTGCTDFKIQDFGHFKFRTLGARGLKVGTQVLNTDRV